VKKIGLFVAALVLVACTSGVKSNEGGARLRVFYNNDNFSYLEPCGCRVSPIGGMHRRWNAMVAYPQESRLFLDAGNMLFKTTKAAEYLAPQWFEQAVGVIEAYNVLNADAATPGETDFALGVKKFEELANKANFPFVSANIYRKGSDKLFLRDSVMIQRLGKKIGVFGIFHPSLRLPEELEARDAISHAKSMVKKLRDSGADMVIALSHQGYDNDMAFLKEVSGIDLLVGANSQSLLQSPDLEGETLVVQLSSQGQMLGMVEYEAATLPKRRTDFLVAELNAEYDNSPKGMANPMKNLLAVTNLRMAEANRKLDEGLWAAHEGKGVSYDTYISCRDCHSKQSEFQDGKLHAAAFLTLLSKKQETNLDCVKCHSVGLGMPGGFRNMQEAFRDAEGNPVSLEKIQQHLGAGFPAADANYRENQERVRPDVAKWNTAMHKAGVKKSFVTVQCESCHGAMGGHPFANDGPIQPKKVATALCLNCHTKEQMPAWYEANGKVKQESVAAALKLMACPK
jgi:hypothetical protein